VQTTSALQNNRGLSLVEVIVSLLIMTVMLLGLAQTITVAISTNMQNVFRDEAVNVAEARMNGVLIDTSGAAHDGMRNMPFANISLLSASDRAFTVTRTFRGSATMNYTVNTLADNSISGATITASEITINVQWVYKGKTYTQSTLTIIRSNS
jgi:Tfp pilus assembly protein PilV